MSLGKDLFGIISWVSLTMQLILTTVVRIGKRVLSYSITPLHVSQHCGNKSQQSKIVPTARIWILLYSRSVTSLSLSFTHTHKEAYFVSYQIHNSFTSLLLTETCHASYCLRHSIAISDFLFWETIPISPVFHQQSAKKENRPLDWTEARCPRSGQCYS